MRYCFVGDDFRFGSGREGDFSMLKKMSLELQLWFRKNQLGFQLVAVV
jgi:FAD synthase